MNSEIIGRRNILMIFSISLIVFLENKLKNLLFVLLISLYSFIWIFPFYNAENFKLTLKKPIYKIFNID